MIIIIIVVIIIIVIIILLILLITTILVIIIWKIPEGSSVYPYLKYLLHHEGKADNHGSIHVFLAYEEFMDIHII